MCFSRQNEMWKASGQVVSVLLSFAQWFLLVQFPIEHESDDRYWLLLLLYIPAGGVLLLWFRCGSKLAYLWLVWLLYTFFLVITNAVVFGLVATQLSEDWDWGPHVLEATLSIAPLLLLALLNVVADSRDKRRQYILISFRLTLDLFDAIDMLGATLEKAGRPRDDVPQEFRIVVYCIVIVAFLMSAAELWNQVKEKENRCVSFSHILINAAFLILRGILWGKFHRPAPLFLAKSGIYTVAHIIEICC